MRCIFSEKIVCMKKIITKDFEERPGCLSISFEHTADSCIDDWLRQLKAIK